jgi:hypothetical protein
MKYARTQYFHTSMYNHTLKNNIRYLNEYYEKQY